MSELSKNYTPDAVEDKWYQHWTDKGYFNSKPDGRAPFTVAIPPPNVTGVLHMGHTLNETVQDVLVRKARMSGYNACWVPGSDHASIATEAKVVQMLEKEKGISKHRLTREAFLRHAFEWKEKYGGIIYHQIKKLGCSVDWNRVTFTMDDHYYKAVINVFVDLYNKGLIYRGARMINWDPAAQTALSDEEVEYRDVQGKLYYVKYKVVKRETADARQEGFTDAGALPPHNDYVLIATQRPETIMGDTAVCVNPNDARYQYLKGAKVIVPLVNREVPVVFDDYVDPSFGTGALKVTPAHDVNDYNLGLKHNLPAVDTLNPDGTLSEAAEVFVGMDRFDARKAAVEKLREEGLLVKEEEYGTRLGYSQRTAAVVEPRISTQWFVKMRALADKALEAVTSGAVKIHPEERFLATYKYWLENVKDWCISRQLWWGQRIPAWYDESGRFVVAETEEEARKSFEAAFNSKPALLTQDEDVLDTWFSSWIWPIEVFNGITQPDNEDIKYYYPTSVLVTGQDIIFFWVARMIMAGEEYRAEKPFSDVYFTGMVRDRQGRKMSKQLGNSPDLLKLIEDFGADAVRFGILISAPAGNDLLFDESSCEQGKHFNNKLWNALRLVREVWQRAEDNSIRGFYNEGEEPELSRWIPQPDYAAFSVAYFGNRLKQVASEVEKLYSGFKISEVLKKVYALIWDDFCSSYLEWIKPKNGRIIDAETYDATVRFFEELMHLLHPFMPFITEEIYHQLTNHEDDLCVRQSSRAYDYEQSAITLGLYAKQVFNYTGHVRKEGAIKNAEELEVIIISNGEEEKVIQTIQPLVEKYANVRFVHGGALRLDKTYNRLIIQSMQFYIEKKVDDIDEFKAKLIADIEYQRGFLTLVEKKLSNEQFMQKAKPELIELELKKKADADQKLKSLNELLMKLP